MSEHDGTTASTRLQDPSRAQRLQELLLSTEGVESFLQELVEIAVEIIDEEVSAGITVVRDGHPGTVASSDADAARYDEIQYGQDAGPCLTAIRTGRMVLIEDLASDDRFGSYRAHALAAGVRSALALPMDGGDHAVGALNLYSVEPHTFGPAEQDAGRRFAGEASRALGLAARFARQSELTEQLQTALTSRTVIDQAMGIIMAQNRCDADEAFAVLRAASQHRNLKVRVIAEEIVSTIARPRKK